MGTRNAFIAVAAVAASMTWQLAAAQASSPTRADVKAETRAAEKSGTLARPGELGGPVVKAPEGSGTKVTRAERKKATREANKAGKLARPGSSNAADNAIRAQPTTASRADRKSDTRAANKRGELESAGEASTRK
jgi:hypothetical protein